MQSQHSVVPRHPELLLAATINSDDPIKIKIISCSDIQSITSFQKSGILKTISLSIFFPVMQIFWARMTQRN